MGSDPYTGRTVGLAGSYALASFPIVLVLMVGLGWWVTRSIESQVIRSAAGNVALYVQSFLTPALQDLEPGGSLKPETIERIEGVLTGTPLGARIRALKIWQQGGRIAYYSRRELIGHKFPISDGLRRAWSGEVAAGLDDLTDEEDAEEARIGIPLLEVYSPVRGRGSDRIVAVVEFYQDARALRERLRETRLRTWLVVVLATLTTFGLLFGIVLRGSRVIKRQREELGAQVARLTALLEQNEHLTDRVRRAARGTTETNEHLLRQISAELHDGPAQSMSLVLLRLDSLSQSSSVPIGEPETQPTIDELRTAVQDSLTEIRELSRGLALPELDGLGLRETLDRAVSTHEKRTGVRIHLNVSGQVPAGAGASVKLTLYRLVQEALMNAHRHGDEGSATISARFHSESLDIEVRDPGPGFDVSSQRLGTDRLGLHGLRERVEALGGVFEVISAPGQGTRVCASLPTGIAS